MIMDKNQNMDEDAERILHLLKNLQNSSFLKNSEATNSQEKLMEGKYQGEKRMANTEYWTFICVPICQTLVLYRKLITF